MSRGAITPMELVQCRTRLRIGAELTVAANPKGEHGFAERPMRRGRVTARYPHVATLGCGTSITYVQMLQQRRTGERFIDQSKPGGWEYRRIDIEQGKGYDREREEERISDVLPEGEAED